jgi:hypothetical protein
MFRFYRRPLFIFHTSIKAFSLLSLKNVQDSMINYLRKCLIFFKVISGDPGFFIRYYLQYHKISLKLKCMHLLWVPNILELEVRASFTES